MRAVGTTVPRLLEPDRPWMMRTYAGHSDAKRSNELYRLNLAKGQTGLSVAFDLPTQIGYDPDHELACGEVGKVGVSVAHEGDMRALLHGIPLQQMNTSITANATAAWLLALYIVAAEEQGVAEEQLRGTIQNDILKEYVSRGTYAFPPGPSMRLVADTIAYTVLHVPKWNPINICSYHLQEAGATPVQEIAYAISNAMAVLDAVAKRVPAELMGCVFGRISFLVNAGVRFIEEHAKLRAMAELWDDVGRERCGVKDDKNRRFRYGVQVNSLGLTEAQPENNVHRIVLELMAAMLGRDARARAVQLPAWNEALGLPRPWDQQWSLRLQQVLAYETDLLEYPDIFEGSRVMNGLIGELRDGARVEMRRVAELGGAVEAVDYIKSSLVESHRERWRRIESGELTVVGMNRFTSTESSPLTAVTALFAETDYGRQIGYMEDIKHDLETLERRLHKDGNPEGDVVGRILVLIDDLDRCEPEKAVEMLQAVNLLLNFTSFIVCLGIDARIVTGAVEKHYEGLLGRTGASGYEYLDKIVQIPFRIPEPGEDEIRTFLGKQLGDPQPPAATEPAARLAPGFEPLNDESEGDEPSAEPQETLRGPSDAAAPPDHEVDGDIAPEAVVPFTYAELQAFEALASHLRPNPRHLKRLVNVYRLVRALARAKGDSVVLEHPAATIRWLVMWAQWPYTSHAMLARFEQRLEEANNGLADDRQSDEPLIELLNEVEPQLDATARDRLDDDLPALRDLLSIEGYGFTSDQLRRIRRYTLNFNPAVEEQWSSSDDGG